MAVQLRQVGLEFTEAFEAMNDAAAACRRVRPLPASVSTITFTGRLVTPDGQALRVPVEDVRLSAMLALELGDAPPFEVDAKRALTASRDGHRYQLSLRRNGKGIKLFHNGSVHVTGCGSPLEFLEVVDALLGFVADTCGVDASLAGFAIQLINVLFVVTCPATGRPMTVAPGAFADSLPEPGDFDAERHPSVKIPLWDGAAKVATACVFQTGTVSIIGARGPRHVAAAYALVCRYLEAAPPGVCAPDAARSLRTTTARQPLFVQDGYPFAAANCCVF